MSKYEPLTSYLSARSPRRVVMTFAEMEHVLGSRLPPSARRHRAWWSNNPSGNVAALAWRAAGYRSAEVDLEAEKLVFEAGERHDPGPHPADESRPASRHPLLGAMKGQITIRPGTDLTAPADPDWGNGSYESFVPHEHAAPHG